MSRNIFGGGTKMILLWNYFPKNLFCISNWKHGCRFIRHGAQRWWWCG